MSNYLEESYERERKPIDDDDVCVQRIEMEFAIPVYITQDQQRALHDLLSDIVKRPENQVKGGCHWVSGYGSKPRWSAMDAAFLGVTADPNAPASGEPTFDDSVMHFETTARPKNPGEK